MKKTIPLPPLEEVLRRVSYDPVTGQFRYIGHFFKGGNSWLNGHIAGTVQKDSGYVLIRLNRKPYRAHRLAWYIMTGSPPEFDIDHRDLNRANNAWLNLRAATPEQNQWNRSAQRNNKLGVKGVHWSEERQKFCVYVQRKNKTVFIGRYLTIDEAIAASAKYRQENHKEFARVA